MKTAHRKYLIGRSIIKRVDYEHLNVNEHKSSHSSTPMASTDLDNAYFYRMRAKQQNILLLGDVNFMAHQCVMLTLTFKENLDDYDKAVKSFKLLAKNLRRHLEDLRYIATIEQQARGAFHFHVLSNLDESLAKEMISRYWHRGITHVKSIDDVKGILLYMTKSFASQDRTSPLYGKRCYFLSQGLQKYTEVNTWHSPNEVQRMDALLSSKVPFVCNTVNNTRSGETVYSDYSNDVLPLPEVVLAKRSD